jgi:hypothetical protein
MAGMSASDGVSQHKVRVGATWIKRYRPFTGLHRESEGFFR